MFLTRNLKRKIQIQKLHKRLQLSILFGDSALTIDWGEKKKKNVATLLLIIFIGV